MTALLAVAIRHFALSVALVPALLALLALLRSCYLSYRAAQHAALLVPKSWQRASGRK